MRLPSASKPQTALRVQPAKPIAKLTVDQHVGKRVKERRKMLGLTQQQVAEALNIVYTQVHRHETGTNRISAERLYYLSQILDVSPEYFYDELEGRARSESDNSAKLEEFMKLMGAVCTKKLPETRKYAFLLILGDLTRAMAAGKPSHETHPPFAKTKSAKKSEHLSSDERLGKSVRELRVLKGMFRDRLSERLNKTEAQIGKYETGENTIMASTLFEISQVLKTPIIELYHCLDDEEEPQRPVSRQQTAILFMQTIQAIKNKKDLEILLGFTKAYAGLTHG